MAPVAEVACGSASSNLLISHASQREYLMTDKPRRARRLPNPVRIIRGHPRLATGIVVGIAVMAALHGVETTRRFLIGWDAGVVLYLVLVFTLMARSGIEHIRGHAARTDEGRVALLVLTVVAAAASLGAIIAELGISRGGSPSAMQLALAVITIVLSWIFTHTIFALHYAHDYYGEHGGKVSGLAFPGEDKPDYWDFVYFSFVIGMTSQVSDVAVTSRLIRRTVNAHGIVSFFFNAALLALTVNIAAGAISEKVGPPGG
jgi:uncharacterized membrane protein